MELTVNKTGFNAYSNYSAYNKTGSVVSKHTNVINNTNPLSFNGFFIKRKPADPYNGEQRIYGGKYKVCSKEIKDNDCEAGLNVRLACNCYEAKPYMSDEEGIYDTKRVDEETLKTMSMACLSLFVYYSEDRTSFPQFYDLMARALPKACAERDKHSMNDNASRMYDVMTQQIMGYGNLCDPGTTNPLESGIKYLYFTNDVPSLRRRDDETSTIQMLQNMSKGRRPVLGECGANPRCCTSWVKDEIHTYGTPYILQKYALDRSNPQRKTNLSGMKKNPNFTTVEPPKPEPDLIEIDPWEYNP